MPTPAELEILAVLWSRGPSTCREVHEALPRRDRVGYTTVLKLLQIMVTKGLADREEGEGRSHVYRAVASEATTQRQLVRDLIDRRMALDTASRPASTSTRNPNSNAGRAPYAGTAAR